MPDAQGEPLPVPCQRAADEVPNERWDVLIVGAGPAGATAALHLARRGHRVLLLDRERFPRHKTCGDLLIADALQALDGAGLAQAVQEAGHEVRRFSFFSPARSRFDLPTRCLTLQRRHLDALLAGAAVAAGAVFSQGAVARIAAAEHSVSCVLHGSARVYHARVGVLATGASVDLLRGLGRKAPSRTSALALRCYVRSPVPVEQLVVSLDRAVLPGYGWIFPLGGDQYNIGCGVFERAGQHKANLRQLFRGFAAGFPLAAELLGRAETVSPLCGARLRCGLRDLPQAHTGNWLAVGETVGATYPLTGEGIGKAMRTAELAAEAIDDALRTDDRQRLEQFPKRLQSELLPRYRGYQRAEDWFARPWLADLLARRACASASLRETMAGILNETLDPGVLFSFRGALRALWG